MTTSIVATTVAEHWDGPGPWWPVFPIIWVVIVIGAIVAFTVLGRRRRWAVGAQTGEARLADRYAAGEIDDAEYEERLATLKRLSSR